MHGLIRASRRSVCQYCQGAELAADAEPPMHGKTPIEAANTEEGFAQADEGPDPH